MQENNNLADCVEESTQELAQTVELFTEEVREGNAYVLKTYGMLKALMAGLDATLKELLPYAINEAEKYSKEEQQRLGFAVTSRTTYSYKNIPEIADLQAKIKELQKAAQQAGTAERSVSTFITFRNGN